MEIIEHLVEENTNWQVWSGKKPLHPTDWCIHVFHFSLKHLAVVDLLHQHIHLLYFHFTTC